MCTDAQQGPRLCGFAARAPGLPVASFPFTVAQSWTHAGSPRGLLLMDHPQRHRLASLGELAPSTENRRPGWLAAEYLVWSAWL